MINPDKKITYSGMIHIPMPFISLAIDKEEITREEIDAIFAVYNIGDSIKIVHVPDPTQEGSMATTNSGIIELCILVNPSLYYTNDPIHKLPNKESEIESAIMYANQVEDAVYRYIEYKKFNSILKLAASE